MQYSHGVAAATASRYVLGNALTNAGTKPNAPSISLRVEAAVGLLSAAAEPPRAGASRVTVASLLRIFIEISWWVSMTWRYVPQNDSFRAQKQTITPTSPAARRDRAAMARRLLGRIL